jgi:hypothetical protein
MKLTAIVLVAVAGAFASNAALAQLTADDRKWINQCVVDNKGGAAEPVLIKYCTCMNNKMSNNENQSVTQWEKTHPVERTECDKDSGWK